MRRIQLRGSLSLSRLAAILIAAGSVTLAQPPGSGLTGPPGMRVFSPPVEHMGFDRPEAWALKYFAASTLLSGLEPYTDPREARHPGSISVGFEADWLPRLSAVQQHVAFNGTAPDELNKAPAVLRPVVRIGLPWQLTAIIAVPPPFHAFGVTPHLVAFGVEGPIAEGDRFQLAWRGYGQLGTVKGAFTCSATAVASPPGSPANPYTCVRESGDVATLRYAGAELSAGYRIPKWKLTPHVAVGANLVDGVFQTDAPLAAALDRTRFWTRGAIASGSAGVSYAVSRHISFTVDAFYSPLLIRRQDGAPRVNDGLFNVRALLNYTLR